MSTFHPPTVDVSTHWDPVTATVRTNLTGSVSVEDVQQWRVQLHATMETLPEGTTFRLLLNLRDFEPVDIEAHKAMRTVIPLLLAAHGMRPAYIDLFDERPELSVTSTRSVRCVAFANVHHDPMKMHDYQQRIGRADQIFVTDVAFAERWLHSVPLPAGH